MELKEFSIRLAQLRMNKGISARQMSLDLGQSESYINNIETGHSFPSMTVFFYICEYLNITPQEFFETDSKNPEFLTSLIQDLKHLDRKQLDTISSLVKGLLKK